MTDILNWVKAHLLIVLFSAIILVSIPTGVFFGNGRDAAVREPLEKRVRATETLLKGVERTPVQIQALHPGVAPFDEQMVITESILNEYRDIRESIRRDADEILKTAEEINRADHYDELVAGLLPAPRPEDAQALPYQINPAYLRAHEELLTRLNAGDPVSEEMLGDTLDDFASNYVRTQLNQEAGESLTEEDEERLTAALTTRRMLEYRQHAEGISVYADLSIFNLKPWDDGRGAPTPSMWFDWQHAYWVNQDIVKAINHANSAGSADGSPLDAVFGNPGSVVKRIEKIELFPMFDIRAKAKRDQFGSGFIDEEMDFSMMEGGVGLGEGGGPMKGGKGYEYSEGSGGRGNDVASGVSNDDAADVFEDDFAASPSGRSTNPLYDVRKVKLTVVVDSNRLPLLINSIQQTNFMTVTGCRLQKVNILNHLRAGYAYGNEPVVRAILDIETLWLRDWTRALMPDEVKESLGIELANADQDQDNGGG